MKDLEEMWFFFLSERVSGLINVFFFKSFQKVCQEGDGGVFSTELVSGLLYGVCFIFLGSLPRKRWKIW